MPPEFLTRYAGVFLDVHIFPPKRHSNFRSVGITHKNKIIKYIGIHCNYKYIYKFAPRTEAKTNVRKLLLAAITGMNSCHDLGCWSASSTDCQRIGYYMSLPSIWSYFIPISIPFQCLVVLFENHHTLSKWPSTRRKKLILILTTGLMDLASNRLKRHFKSHQWSPKTCSNAVRRSTWKYIPLVPLLFRHRQQLPQIRIRPLCRQPTAVVDNL